MRLFCLALIAYILYNCSGQDITKQDFNDIINAKNFRGKVVLVTGSSSGIGKVIVKLFARLGAQVVITGRNVKRIRRTAQEVKKLSPKGLKPLQVVADVTNDDDLERLLRKTVSTFGKLDILVNNVGTAEWVGIRNKKFMCIFDRTMATDLRSAVYLTHMAVPQLLKSNGTVISVSSIASLNPRPFTLPYAAAKAGIDVLTQVLALELGPRIRVNSVCPGVIETGPPQDGLVRIIRDRAKIDTPLKRVGKPIDVAKGVVFLASSDANFITGMNIRIDGGYMFNSI